jgi:hypothetical protein
VKGPAGADPASRIAAEFERIGGPPSGVDPDRVGIEAVEGDDVVVKSGMDDRWVGAPAIALMRLAQVEDGAGPGAFWAGLLRPMPGEEETSPEAAYAAFDRSRGDDRVPWKDVVAEQTERAEIAAANLETAVATARKKGSEHTLIDGEEFGFPGEQLHVIGGKVLFPRGSPGKGLVSQRYDDSDWECICRVGEDGLRRFKYEGGGSKGVTLGRIGVGNGEVVIHARPRRGRFPVSSIVGIHESDLLVRPPAPVRYWHVFARRKQRVSFFGLESQSAFLHALGGIARVYAEVANTYKLCGEIATLAYERNLSLRQASLEAGLPGDFYDALTDTYRYAVDSWLPFEWVAERRGLVARFRAIEAERETQAGG